MLLSDILRKRKKNFLLEIKKKKRRTEKIDEKLQKNLSNHSNVLWQSQVEETYLPEFVNWPTACESTAAVVECYLKIP